MEGTLLALWALLLGWDQDLLWRGPRAAPRGFAGGTTQPGTNLTCYQCFKADSEALCVPTACSAEDRVCLSHTLIFSLQSGEKVSLSKRCAPQCPGANSTYAWLSDTRVLGRIHRRCCNRSLCNGAPPAPGRPWALRGALLLPLGLTLPGALL